LLAAQKEQLSSLAAVATPTQSIDLDFTTDHFGSEDLEGLVLFARRSGLLSLLAGLSHPCGYLPGVEVGLDTHARKNRGGALERLVEAKPESLAAADGGLSLVKQVPLGTAVNNLGVPRPPLMDTLRLHFVVLARRMPTGIEFRYYAGAGSKPSETTNAYIRRAEVLDGARRGLRLALVGARCTTLMDRL